MSERPRRGAFVRARALIRPRRSSSAVERAIEKEVAEEIVHDIASRIATPARRSHRRTSSGKKITGKRIYPFTTLLRRKNGEIVPVTFKRTYRRPSSARVYVNTKRHNTTAKINRFYKQNGDLRKRFLKHEKAIEKAIGL